MLALFFAVAVLIAQDATPAATPTPAPDLYEDAAMHFRAPEGWLLAGRRYPKVDQLGEDPTPVAAWVQANKDHPRKLIIAMEQYSSQSISNFESDYEGQIRDQLDSPFFKEKDHVQLHNGMPAMFVVVTSGSGFDTHKKFLLEWVDGVRGVVVSLEGSYGDLDPASAKKILLSDVSAVQYPFDQP